MKITVLGCCGGYPFNGGSCSGYLLEGGGAKIVLDLGGGSLTELMKHARIEDIDAVFLSHLHYDHTSDLLLLKYLLDMNGIRKINLVTAYEDSELYRVTTGGKWFNVINIDENTELSIKGLRLKFFKAQHAFTDYAIRIEGDKTFVYSGDSVYCRGIERAIEGADVFLADCCQPEGSKASHMTVIEAVKIAQNVTLKLIATHLSPFYDPKAYLSAQNILVAEQGKTYTF